MRAFLALLLVPVLLAGCTPRIPVKEDFAVSALAPVGDIPPEFSEFNNFDPAVARLLADQICALPYQPLEEKTLGAAAGRLVQLRGRCATHIPLYGP